MPWIDGIASPNSIPTWSGFLPRLDLDLIGYFYVLLYVSLRAWLSVYAYTVLPKLVALLIVGYPMVSDKGGM